MNRGDTFRRRAEAPSGFRLHASGIAMLMAGCVALNGCSGRTAEPSRPSVKDKAAENWLSSGRTEADQHYSPLATIHTGNVKDLGLAWFLDLPGQRTLQATPLAIDGVLYFSGTHGWVFAVNGRTGQKLWQFDPELANHPLKSKRPLFGSNRGVAYWAGKIYVGTVDGRLVALDIETGQVFWATQTLDEPGMSKIISGAPRAFNGKVVIGHGGYDKTRGYVTAYDARNGRKLWRFYTVPGNPAKGFENAAMEKAAQTWTGEWWKEGGHSTVWDAIAYDPEFNRVYFGTASSMTAGVPGDKLFSASIVALEADTGAYAWHYQNNPGGSLDYEMNYDAASQTMLADLVIGGNPRKVLIHAPKNGFFYVIDRSTGELISAEKYEKVNWADHIDLETGRPIRATLVKNEGGSVRIWPSSFGAHDWQKMSFHPGAALVYIPTMRRAREFGPADDRLVARKNDDGSGGLLAWDPVAQKKRWEVRYAESFWNGGTLATAGNLVFHGTGRGHLLAYDAHTGTELWRFDAGLGINAAPMSYAVDGVQYVSILVGYGGTANTHKVADHGWRFNEQPRRLLTFALGKKTFLPAGQPPRFKLKPLDEPAVVIDADLAARGAQAYERCAACHGVELNNYASLAPDLRESALALSWEGFNAVVRGGTLAAAGMPRFDDMSEEEVRALYMYVRQRSREAARAQK